MAYLLIDDGFADHRKVIGLSDKAFRLHVCALVYVAKNELDGAISDLALRISGANSKIGRPKRIAKELIAAGLWEVDTAKTGGVYRIHDYLKHNPSRLEIAESRAKARDRKRKWRRGQNTGRDAGQDAGRPGVRNATHVPPKGGTPKGGSLSETTTLQESWSLFVAGHSWDETFHEDQVLDELDRRRRKYDGFITDNEALEQWRTVRAERYPQLAPSPAIAQPAKEPA